MELIELIHYVNGSRHSSKPHLSYLNLHLKFLFVGLPEFQKRCSTLRLPTD